MSFRFDTPSEELLQIADKEARRLGHDFIGTEHVLLGVLAVMRGGLANTLRSRKVDRESVRTEVERWVCPEPCKPEVGPLALTPRARRALKIAGREARKVKESHVTADHVLFGLMLEGSGVAAKILQKLGIHIEQLRREISKERLDQP